MTVAYRGSRKLSTKELRAHLASLLRLENVGVLLGAGASIEAGGRAMSNIWKKFETSNSADHKWLYENDFLSDTHDVETLLDNIEISITEWRRTSNSNLDNAKSARIALYKLLIQASKLKKRWWISSFGPGQLEPKLASHRELLRKISSIRQPGQPSPWIFTTNYDLAVEWTADSIDLNVINGFQGTQSRKFYPQSFDLGYQNVQTRGEARFGTYHVYLAKLHGSLTWKKGSDGEVYELQASEAWKSIREFCNGTSTELPFSVLPSAAKYLQTVGFVFGELIRRFSEFMSRSQTALMICGYGFGDDHVNRLLWSAVMNPTLQLVIYFPSFSGMDSISNLPSALQKLITTRNPRVTIVGDAYFNKFASHLPEPAIYDPNLKKLEERIKKNRS